MSSLCLLLSSSLFAARTVYAHSVSVEVLLSGIYHDSYDRYGDVVGQVIGSVVLPDGFAAAMSPKEGHTASDYYNESAFAVHQSVGGVDSADDVDQVVDFYSDLSALGQQIEDNPLNDGEMSILGNLVLCDEAEEDAFDAANHTMSSTEFEYGMCGDSRVGPDGHEHFWDYRPVAVHMETASALTVVAEDDDDSDRIEVLMAWYLLSDGTADRDQVLRQNLFPSADGRADTVWLNASTATATVEMGLSTANYSTNWLAAGDEVGTPSSWPSDGEWYASNDSEAQYLLYVYSVAVVCSNDAVFVEFMASDDGGSGGYGLSGWEIIGIIFGCIVFLAVICLGMSSFLGGDCSGNNQRKGGYKRPNSNADDIEDVLTGVEMEEANGITTAES